MAGNRTIFAGGSIVLHEGQIRILLSGPEGETSVDIRRRATAVQKRAKRAAPFRTGALRTSIRVNTRYPSTGAVAEVTAFAPYAMFVEFGRKQNYAKEGGWMMWTEAGRYVFAERVKAVAAHPFMRPALDAVDE